MAVSRSFPPPPPPPLAEPAPPPPSNDDAPPPPPTAAFQPPPPLKRKREPMDLEDVLKKKREAELASAKPTFLSKKERERLALEKRQKEVEEQKRRTQAERGFAATNGVGDNHGIRTTADKGYSNGVHGSNGSHRQAIPTGPRAMRASGSSREEMPPPPPQPAQKNGVSKIKGREGEKESKPETAEEKSDREHLERYMGASQAMSKFSAKKRKRAEKKFVFEWGKEEDTSQDFNPLYQNRSEASFYGRGRLGGYDSQDVESYAKAIASRDQVAGSERARELLDMERRRKEAKDNTSIDVHWSEKPLSAMRERDYRIMREDFAIATRGGQIPNPLRSWNEAGLPQQLLDLVSRSGYNDPTPVQRAAVPCAMAGRDVLAVAKTGSGKTASYLLPLLVYILHRISVDNPREDCPYAVIMAPTRELAQQIQEETRKFAQPLGISSVVVVGGHNISIDARALFDESTDILIATPGRLADCIEQKVVNLSDTKYLVLDEVDRMLDMGFEQPISVIMNALNSSSMKPDTEEAEQTQAMTTILRDEDRYRTTMMYTATLPASVERTTRTYLRRPAVVQIGVKEEAAETIEQRVEFISGEDKKRDRLLQLLNHEFVGTVLVFVNIKAQCDAMVRQLQRGPHHLAADSLHGGKDQSAREAAVAAVRRGDTRILVATDLAGRGLDIPDVQAVINYNLPKHIEPYTHRIGRTGRAGKHGTAVSFMDNSDQEIMYDLRVMLQRSPLSRVPEELRRHEASQKPFVRGQQRG
ncbi:MAG: mRNA splicing protein prp28 [Chrysothrix sp. TS-e1954]|nr:MAG: mRNA splicing protein prp28 [Chrysothrix sp. TS-e1954]